MLQRVQPNTTLLSAGIYSFLSAEQQQTLNLIAKRRVYTINQQDLAVEDALLLIHIDEEGVFNLEQAEFVFSNTLAQSKKEDISIRAYPTTNRPDIVPRPTTRIRFIAERRPNLVFRVRLRDLHYDTPQEERSILVVQERLAYALMTSIKAPTMLLAMVYLIQARITPTRAYVNELISTTKQLEQWHTRYNTLQMRMKHDTRSCEAVKAPYEVYNHQLERVATPMATKKTVLPDQEVYLLVPPSANVYLCLLRKSVRLITPQMVSDFLLRPDNTGVYLSLVSIDENDKKQTHTQNNMISRQKWSTRLTPEEKLLCGVAPITMPPERLLPELKKRLFDDLDEEYAHKQAVIHSTLPPLLQQQIRPFTRIKQWNKEALIRYLNTLLSHRMKVLDACGPPNKKKVNKSIQACTLVGCLCSS